MLVAMYVNDIVIAYNNQSMLRSFKDKLTTKSKCKDLGELSNVLNMGITQTGDGGLFLLQEATCWSSSRTMYLQEQTRSSY